MIKLLFVDSAPSNRKDKVTATILVTNNIVLFGG